MTVTDIESEAKFNDAIKSDKVTLVHFVAQWAGPCRPNAAVFEMTAKGNTNAQFFSLDTDNIPDTMQKYRITTLPVIHSYKSGAKVGEIKGLTTKEKIEQLITDASA